VPSRIAAVVKELKELRKGRASPAEAAVSAEALLANASRVGDARVVVASTGSGDAAAMRQCLDQLRRKAAPIAVLLGGSEDGKVTLVAGLSRELEARGLAANEWIREPATIVGGRGGGRRDLAQAGGKLAEKLDEALAAGKAWIERALEQPQG